MEKILTGRPSFPRLQRAGGIFSSRNRARQKQMIGIRYDIKRDAIVREAMALKAAVEPMFMSERRVVIAVVVRMELTGTFAWGWMYRKNPENGRALSRAKAKVCLDVVARILIALQTSRARMIAESPLAAASECVALEKACMKENPVGGSRTDSTLPMVKRYVIRIINPRVPLIRAVEIIHQGTTVEASRISSAR